MGCARQRAARQRVRRARLCNRAGMRRKQYLHVAKCNGDIRRIQEFRIKYVVEVGGYKNLRTIGASFKEMSDNTTEESCTI